MKIHVIYLGIIAIISLISTYVIHDNVGTTIWRFDTNDMIETDDGYYYKITRGRGSEKEELTVSTNEKQLFVHSDKNPKDSSVVGVDHYAQDLTNLIPLSEEPQLLIVSSNGHNLKYFQVKYNEKENSFFSIIEKIYCSDDSYAKKLVEEFQITPNTIMCEEE